MNKDSGASVSLWMATEEIPSPPPLTEDVTADVCVVGAGLAGMSTAYLLAREGHSVVLLEDGPIGGGATGRTTAHISSGLDDGYREYEKRHGLEGARIAAQSATAAVDLIERIAVEEGIHCDFARVDGYLFNPPGKASDILDRELEAAHRAGFTSVERLARAPIEDFDSGVCLRFPNQGQFHPLRYLAGLEKAIARHGGRIHCHTRAQRIEGGANAHVETADGRRVSAGAVVVATNSPVNDRVAIHSKQAPYRSYVIAGRIANGTVPAALYWDTAEPYHYVRIHTDRRGGQPLDYLIVGGEDHRTGHETEYEQRFGRLEQWARDRFPTLRSVDYRWSGQVMEPADGLPFIGRNPGDAENVFVITGDSGDGMTNATIGAMLITDLAMGRRNPWATLYDPSRKILSALDRFVGFNLDVASHYAEHLTGGEVESVDAIPPESGAIVRQGLRKLAVYRDADGVLHRRSAACTHLQCLVHWNRLEKSWDCPCHGSRFDPYGRVLNGPANQALPPAE